MRHRGPLILDRATSVCADHAAESMPPIVIWKTSRDMRQISQLVSFPFDYATRILVLVPERNDDKSQQYGVDYSEDANHEAGDFMLRLEHIYRDQTAHRPETEPGKDDAEADDEQSKD